MTGESLELEELVRRLDQVQIDWEAAVRPQPYVPRLRWRRGL